ncbi:peptidase M23 [Hahella sp. CCB-MM4]|uniref:peptidoglycan DD-metalloendopeptidase family protein n=1 Tax=Hahella sp. (strain CCB-MM4) TaxID=1926491 RepID=UPI000B9C2A5A|nr:peptidoglycan DD-metalloendopeptidase family protein [Hahella sp. CCB-MM4]OZG72473.1 peptidase M23 [Hahella sp. CCB-MM4]
MRSGVNYAYKCAWFVIAIFLTSCTSPNIYQDPDFNPPVYWGSHRVSKGDTLYSIAWRYGRDYKELAEINNIPPPYIIKIGQRISLVVPEDYVFRTRKPAPTPAKSSKSTQSPPAQVASKKPVYKKKQKPSGTSNKYVPQNVSGWGWPHPGPIIDTYSVTGEVNKGVDIAGKIGDPVVAAASGEVVYAGSGLLGYGKLVIVNHSETYLSAYAHNRKILVKEGDYVKLGQQIAELGQTGAKRPMLHFEIRKNGKPVDPLTYLPKK